MSLLQISRRQWAFILVLILVAAAAAAIALINNPGEAVLEVHENGADILFQADRRLIVSPGECVNVRWQVENVRTVRINDEPTVGSGESRVCIDEKTLPTLTVKFDDEMQRDYQLDIAILSRLPATWIIAFSALLFVPAAVYLALPVTAGQKVQPLGSQLRRLGKPLLLMGFGLLMALVMLELMLRLYFSIFGSAKDRLLYTASQDEILAALETESTHVPLPFANYGLSPYHEEHNRLGYRGPENEIPKPEGMFRIIVFGGSTTYGLGMGWQEAYPAQLERILREDYGYGNVEVINAGALGYTSWETLVNFEFRALELEPDLIIVYDGVNDAVARTASRDCYAGMNPIRGFHPLRDVWELTTDAPSPSTLYRYLSINLGWVKNPLELDSVRQENHLCDRSDAATQLERVQANPPTYFRRNLRNIAAIGKANDVLVLLSTWAYYKTEDMEVLPDWWRLAVDEQNEIILDVANEMDVMSYDLMGNIGQVEDFWFDDAVHQTPQGMEEQAYLYAEYLDAQGVIPKSE